MKEERGMEFIKMFIRKKRTCKNWRKCPYFNRTNCDNNLMDCDKCLEYDKYKWNRGELKE